ncbi:MAG: helix-hairpin-helix domain-containing protein [Planctomycetes bacterium]|nr:helix-hairpin-helix domain-containing protein [Planctomycetota bacterium]
MKDPEFLTRREALAAAGLALGLQALAWWRALSGPSSEDPPGLERLRVDLNRGSLSQLEALPGVGPATARALVAARPIRSREQLRSLLGSKRLRRVQPFIRPLNAHDPGRDPPSGGEMGAH